MASTLYFLYLIVHWLLQALVWVLIGNALLSWLIAFEVINLRNPYARQVAYFFEAVTRPMLAPLRRIIPSLGGVDVTPVILIIVITAVDRALLPGLFAWLGRLAG